MAQPEGRRSDQLWQALYQALHSKYASIRYSCESMQYQREPSAAPFAGGRVGTSKLLEYLFQQIVGHETFRAAHTVLVVTETRPLAEISHWSHVR